MTTVMEERQEAKHVSRPDVTQRLVANFRPNEELQAGIDLRPVGI
jgi:hypothetical protein